MGVPGVAAFADNGGSQEPLGSLLVKRGLITPEQLAEALAQQKTSGELLGAILVTRGFTTGAAIAQALATQHGGLLKTEYGFAVGFTAAGGLASTVAVGEPPVSSPRIGRDAAVVVAPRPFPPDQASDRAVVRAELSMASAETERLSEANERLAAARAALEVRLAQESQRTALLEHELEELRAAGATAGGGDIAKWQEAVAQWQGAYGGLEQRLAERDVELESLRSSVEACASARTDLERALSSEVERSASLKKELAAAERWRASAEAAESERVAVESRLVEVSARAEALEAEIVVARELGASGSEEVRAELEAKLAQADEQLRAADSVRNELEARLAEATQKALGLEEHVHSLDALQRSSLASEQAIGELERRLLAVQGELEARNAELEHRNTEPKALAAAPSVPIGRWTDAHRHLLFFQGAAGYELVERDGPPPAEGAHVREHIVARVASAPFPDSKLPCAYLMPK